MSKVKVIKKGVTLRGLLLNIGETIELPEDSAATLIGSGHCKAIEEAPAEDEREDDDQVDGSGKVDPGSQDEATEDGEEDPELDIIEKQITNALDDKYKRDELYDAAKALDIEIAHNVKKADLIIKIIANGKYDHLV